jgi:hypothetical protein
MKIGLIGNMNNNNFALMRYFRDLGADAHLLLYSNDGVHEASHFTPEADTWEIEKWAPYIHQTQIPNAPVAAFNFPTSWLFGCRAWIREKLGMQKQAVLPVSRALIHDTYKTFDRLVGSGITPATLLRIGRRLDIFYPYSAQVEFLYSSAFTKGVDELSSITKNFVKRVQQRQALGIRHAVHVLNAEPGITEAALNSIGVKSKHYAIPMVYCDGRISNSSRSERLADIEKKISSSSFSVLHHARLIWFRKINIRDELYLQESKNNHWLIRAFSKLVTLRPLSNPLLFIAEYGPDVDATKELIVELGIANNVIWLPTMTRKELMWILSRVSVGIGQFCQVPEMCWGGTGWEVLASGKPLLQGFNFELRTFEDVYGYPAPPMLPVKNEEDVLPHLLSLVDNPKNASEIGKQAKLWFNTYNGIGLAKKWLDLLTACDGTLRES